MTISVHAYSGNPGARLVGIDNRILREGEYVVPGLKLEQITPDGMIFGYKGYSFRRGVKYPLFFPLKIARRKNGPRPPAPTVLKTKHPRSKKTTQKKDVFKYFFARFYSVQTPGPAQPPQGGAARPVWAPGYGSI